MSDRNNVSNPADVLYGATTQAAEAPARKPSTLLGTPSEHREPAPADQPSEETAADQFFGSPESIASAYEPQLRDTLDAFAILGGPELGGPEAEGVRTTLAQEAAAVFHDAGIPPEQAASLHSLVVTTLKTPASDSQVADWRRDSLEWLRTNHTQGHENELKRVREFTNARPGLKRLLEQTGLGDHPAVVRAMMQNANRLRVTPRRHKGASA